MRVAVRKLDVGDVGQLVQLVAENIESLEPGLSVIDACLLLGHATIDIAAVDVEGALVLIAIGTTADEALLMRVVEAYSWCLEYPQAVQRLYPSLRVSAERPPRVIFVVERTPESFPRKMKQINFARVTCVEFRPLEVNGVAAILFEHVTASLSSLPRVSERVAVPPPALATPPVAAYEVTAPSLAGTNGHGAHGNGHLPTPAPAASERLVRDQVRDSAPSPVASDLSLADDDARDTAGPIAEDVLAAARASSAQEFADVADAAAGETLSLHDASPALELERPVAPLDAAALDAVLEEIGLDAAARVGDAPSPVAEPEPMLVLESAAPAPMVDEVATAEEVAAVEPVAAHASEGAAPTAAAAPGLGLRALLDEIATAPVTPPVATPPPPAARGPVERAASPAPVERAPATGLRGLLDEIAKAPAAPAVATPAPAPVHKAPAAAVAPKPATESTGLRGLVSEIEATLAGGAAPATATPTPAKPPAWAKVPEAPKPAATATPAAPTVVPAEAAKDLVAELPADFDNLKFPKDGVLTRQWMEFLNQMASSK